MVQTTDQHVVALLTKFGCASPCEALCGIVLAFQCHHAIFSMIGTCGQALVTGTLTSGE